MLSCKSQTSVATLKGNRKVESYYTLTSLPDSDLVPMATSATQVLLTNLTLRSFLRSLLRRPYVSGRRSAVFGDPLNDAETLRMRVISFGCTYKLVIGVGNQRRYMWLAHTYCGLWFLFLLFATTKMFGGAFEEWKDRLSTNRRSTTTKAESTNRFMDRSSTQRSRVNSAYSNENERIGDLFDEMFSEDNVVEKMIRRIELSDEYQEHCESEDGDEERRRWTMAESRGGRPSFLALVLGSLKTKGRSRPSWLGLRYS